MGYIIFWDNLSSNGLYMTTKAIYEDFHLKTKIWSKSSLDQKKRFWERKEEQREEARVL